MNNVATTLFEIIKKINQNRIGEGKDCKLVVPGITLETAKKLNNLFVDGEIGYSYLVVDASLRPDEAKRWLRPDATTSKRESSFIFITLPGVLPMLPDSIKGSGGAVKNYLYNEEWPWVTNEYDLVNFKSDFLISLLEKSISGSFDQNWFKSLIVDSPVGIKSSLLFRNKNDRDRILFEELLGNYKHDIEKFKSNQESFLFNCGIPRSENQDHLRIYDYLISLNTLKENIEEKINSRLNREEIIDKATEVFDDDTSAFRNLIDGFLDKLLSNSYSSSSALYFREIFKNDLILWERLSIEKIREIFSLHSVVATYNFSLNNIEIANNEGYVSLEKRNVFSFANSLIKFDFTADNPNGEDLIVLARSKKMTSPLQENLDMGNCSLYIDASHFKNYAKKVLLNFILVDRNTGVEKGIVRTYLHLCGRDNPSFLLIRNEEQPGDYVVIERTVLDENELHNIKENIEVDYDAKIILLSFEDKSWRFYKGIREDEIFSTIRSTGQNNYVLELIGNYNPEKIEDGYFDILVENKVDDEGYFISVESEKKLKGNYTLDQECYEVILANSGSKSKLLNEVLEGEQDGGKKKKVYNGLGGRSVQADNLGDIVRNSEDNNNCYPYMVSISEKYLEKPIFSITESGVNVLESQIAFPAQNSPLSADVLLLIKNYKDIRGKILENTRRNVSLREINRPLYAALPIYEHLKRTEIEVLLKKYLETYIEIEIYLIKNPRANLIDKFVLSQLDTVYFFNKAELNENSLTGNFLLMPWHPLMLVKRYYLESVFYKILKKVSRNYYKTIKKKYYLLCYYLEHIDAFKWILNFDGQCYCNATNDHSIVHCFSIKSTDEVRSLVADYISEWFLIRSSFRPDFEDNRVSNYILGYHKAYPIKRSIHCRISNIYNINDIVNDIGQLLYDTKGESVSEEGMKLNGGVHLYSQNKLDSGFENKYLSPPIFVYHATINETNEKLDLEILPPINKVEFKPESIQTSIDLNQGRGSGENIIFRNPSMVVSKNQNDIPESNIYEFDPILRSDEIKANWNSFNLDASYLSAMGLVFSEHIHYSNANFNLPSRFKNQWSVLPGSKVDPAIIREFVRNNNNEYVLWDYNVDMEAGFNSFFIFSNVPKNVIESIQSCEIFYGKEESAKKIIHELSNQGIAIANETLKSTNKAWGVIGLAAALRLFSNNSGVLKNDKNSVGFVIPVDSFCDFLGNGLESHDSPNRRLCDLVCVQIYLEDGKILISAAAIECKYSNSDYSESSIKGALDQAEQTYDRLRGLVNEAKEEDGILERIALQKIINYGLRLSEVNFAQDYSSNEKERILFKLLIEGKVDFRRAHFDKIVVITENLAGTARCEVRNRDLIVKLDRYNWPGVEEGAILKEVQVLAIKLFKIFEKPNIGIQVNPEGEDPTVESDSKPVSLKSSIEDRNLLLNRTDENGIYLSVGTDKTHLNHEVKFWPSNTNLNQLNIGVVGDLGTGKTQLIKSLIYQFTNSENCNRGIKPKFLILDTKRDYDGSGNKNSDKKFVSDIDANVVLPYKMPLNLFDIRNSKGIDPALEKTRFFIDVLTKIYEGIGPVQETNLRSAIMKSYMDRGYRKNLGDYSNFIAPTISDVFENYKVIVKNKIDTPYSKMEELVMTEIFDDRAENCIDFRTFFSKTTVISLGQIATYDRPLKMVLVIFMNLYNQYMLSCNQEEFIGENPRLRFIDSFLLIDEANKIMEYEFPVLNDILIKGRAFGIGVILSSQYLSHFKQNGQNYTEPLLTWFIHKVPNINKRDLEAIGITDISEKLINEIKGLHPHYALFKSLNYNGDVIECTPYYKLAKV